MGTSQAKLVVTLKTVTPLFLGGADPRGEPELRAASVRGALRFWLRALLGGVLGDHDPKILRQAESAVFGSTEMASPVVVRVIRPRLTDKSFKSFSELASDKSGIAYLFFAARSTRDEPTERKAIDAKTEFQLKLEKRAGLEQPDEKAIKWAYCALWLLTHLGGLGTRSRRGAGSLQVTKIIESSENLKDLPPLIISAKTPTQLARELQIGIAHLRQFAGATQSIIVNSPSTFDALHPNVCKIWVLDKEFSTWNEALDTFGRSLQQFRNRLQPDYYLVKKTVHHQQSTPINQPIQRAAFGLPIVFYYKSLSGKKAALEGMHHDRRASPLMLHVTELAPNKYVLVLTFFRAQLLPEGEELKLVLSKNLSISAPTPSFNLIEQFLNNIANNVAPLEEVTGW